MEVFFPQLNMTGVGGPLIAARTRCRRMEGVAKLKPGRS
jgi:hypothetical protein